MLFNTLAYAKFFAVVFVAVWLLVRRSFALWLPWLALATYSTLGIGAALFSRKHVLDVGLVVLALLLTWLLARNQHSTSEEAPPSSRAALLSCAINFAALAWLLRHQAQSNLLSATLSAFGVALHLEPSSIALRLLSDIGAALLFALGAFFFVRARRVRLLFILGASYVFYAQWDWRFLPLIFASSSIDYWLGLKIGASENPVVRKRWLWLTVVVNLGVLAVFKYLGFGVQSALQALNALGFHPEPLVLEIALPIGISFFTFESMSYVIDVYRRHLPAHRSYLEYLSFVAFFPHLVAGPIVRPADLLPQLAGKPRFLAAEGSEGLFLIAWGLLKKVAISDTLGLNLVDRVFDAPTQYSALECYTAVVAYAVQIYCDFSGYTDVAIGSALLLGVRFPLNFNAPYKAASIQEFWRRWHISLSTWLRDYLYVPLGGNRKGTVRTYLNLLLTMLLGGLWHGASFNMVIWGGLHGAALAVERAVSPSSGVSPTAWRRLLGVVITFHFVCVCWIFFRAQTLDQARAIFGQLSQLTTFHGNLHPKVLAILALGLATHFAPERWFQRSKEAFIQAPAWLQGLALIFAALALREMMSAEAVPFVYFQF